MIGLICVWIILNLVFFITDLALDGDLSFVNPICIHDDIEVNWFGAIFIAILLNILLPLPAVGHWLYKLCTVGRK